MNTRDGIICDSCGANSGVPAFGELVAPWKIITVAICDNSDGELKTGEGYKRHTCSDECRQRIAAGEKRMLATGEGGAK